MGKKGFSGQKIDVKDVLRETPAPKEKAAPAWSKGAGAAAKAPPAQAAAKPVASQGAVGGSWARGGPQGLAATATSLNAAEKPKLVPPPRVAGAAKPAPSLGLRKDSRAPGPPATNGDAFPEAQPSKNAQAKMEEKVAAAFPEVKSGQEALVALCQAAGATQSCGDGERLATGLGWLLRRGLAEATPAAQGRLLRAGVLVIDELAPKAEHHATAIDKLLEDYFSEQQAKSNNKATETNGLVDALLFGALARSLEVGSPRRGALRLRLIRRLLKKNTSTEVQQQLAEALVPLLAPEPIAQEEASKSFLESLKAAEEGVRRAGALGVVSVVKAAGGAPALRKFGIMDAVKLLMTAQGKAASGQRHAALLCLKGLASQLGRAFEPYALATMPLLLESCADSSKDVHIAGRDAAKTVVAQVSSNGIKIIVNPVIDALGDKRWRTQLSAVELLDPMVSELAANAPKRLAMVLPKAVPALCEAAAGARGEVRDAARKVLEQLGAVVDHPEVAALSPALISALVDPADGPLVRALDALLTAVYTTPINASACALTCPIVTRALARGDAEARKKGLNFVRTLARFAEDPDLGRELSPYLEAFEPQLKGLLADSAPAVQAAAAQAVGALAAAPAAEDGAGLDWASDLLERLRTGLKGAELEGTAQALAAVLPVLADERREDLLSELVSADGHPADRLGRLSVLAHLPRVLAGSRAGGASLEALLGPLSAALGDEDEALRAVGRRGLAAAAEVAIGGRGANAVAAMVAVTEALERSLSAQEQRARCVAADLSAEVLQQHTGTAASAAVAEPRANLVVGVLLAQADVAAEVRRAADRAWRAFTEAGASPGKQLRELRPKLLQRLAADLAAGSESRAAAAGRAASQLQQRLEGSGGPGLLDDLTPHFEAALGAFDPGVQRSACACLAEILRGGQSARSLRESEVGTLLPQVLLSAGDGDEADALRCAAAACILAAPVAAFVQPMVQELCDLPCGLQLDNVRGLQALFRADTSGAGLTALLGSVGATTSSPAQLSCLAAAAAAPPIALHRVVAEAVVACVDVATEVAGEEGAEAAVSAAAAMVARLDAAGAAAAAEAAASRIQQGTAGRRSEVAAKVLAGVLGAGPFPTGPEHAMDALLPAALQPADAGAAAAVAAAEALQVLVRVCGPASLVELGAPRIHMALKVCDLPNGEDGGLRRESFEALFPVLREGCLGTGTERSASAQAASRLLRLVDAATLQAHAVKCAGPFVRALDKADAEVQCALADALEVLLRRAGSTLRPLAPAMQTSLLRMLDGSHDQQAAATRCVGALAPVLKGLGKEAALVKAISKPPVTAPQLDAIAEVLHSLGPEPIRPEVVKEARAAVDACATDGGKALRDAVARIEAAMAGS